MTRTKSRKHVAVEYGEPGNVKRVWFWTRLVASAYAAEINGTLRLSLVGQPVTISKRKLVTA